MKYKILDHTADVMFEVYGKTLNELFKNAATAIFDTMVKRSTIKIKIKKEIELESSNVEQLLFDFIEELIYIKDAEYLIFKDFKIKIKDNKLTAILEGDKINPKKQILLTDVKAITLHKFSLKKSKQGYKAVIIPDL
ncbi:archease [Candidatus Woesearchaeota archaeon]|nr:archease [Candidatus Woesearchaeota archaeon]